MTALSKTLAVKTLQLEMEYIFAALEDEALDVAQGTEDAGFLLSRCPMLISCSLDARLIHIQHCNNASRHDLKGQITKALSPGK